MYIALLFPFPSIMVPPGDAKDGTVNVKSSSKRGRPRGTGTGGRANGKKARNESHDPHENNRKEKEHPSQNGVGEDGPAQAFDEGGKDEEDPSTAIPEKAQVEIE